MKRKSILLIFLAIWFAISNVSVFATETDSTMLGNEIKVVATLTISDPETGENWEWEVSESDIKILSVFNDGNEKNAVVSVDVGDYLREAFASNPSVSTSLNDDLTITTGLTYSADAFANTVRLYNIFGSAAPKGIYYADDVVVYWRNPGAGIGGTKYPTSDSWSYSTATTAGFYDSSVPPYSLLDCKARISGMSSYRDLSVKCNLML